MFSVVIPLFNKAHTIERTLMSILNQTFTDFEIVIVNDGSTDNGVEVINRFSNDARIRVLNQHNHGVSVARNEGVKRSKFNHIAFIDGDDEWLPNYLTKMKEAIDLFPNAGLFCSAGIVKNADGSEGLRLAKKYKDKILEINFFENPHVFLHTSAAIVSKSYFNKTVGFPIGMKRNEDFAFFFSLALITTAVYSGYPLSIYMGGVPGQATSFSVEKDKNLLSDTLKRYNWGFQNWVNAGRNNKAYIIFLKYELRHFFITQLRNKNYRPIQYYMDNLNIEIKRYFPSCEKIMYQNPRFRGFAIIYLLLTKIRWRMRGYARIK